MKKCTRCKQSKPRSEFARSGVTNDGLYTWCKACYSDFRKTYNKQNAARRSAYNRERNQRPEVKARQVQHVRAFNERNPEKARQWHVDIEARRRARKLENGPVENISRQAVWGRDEGHCRIGLVCNFDFVPYEEMHLDHVIPLCEGGTHTWNNVQTSCKPCNLAKARTILASVASEEEEG